MNTYTFKSAAGNKVTVVGSKRDLTEAQAAHGVLGAHPAEKAAAAHQTVTQRTQATYATRSSPPATISEAEFLERELVCRKCISFVADFPVYRCTEKKGCTKLAIKSPRELCRRGLWPSGSY